MEILTEFCFILSVVAKHVFRFSTLLTRGRIALTPQTLCCGNLFGWPKEIT